jgi:site-specific DNA recombinase
MGMQEGTTSARHACTNRRRITRQEVEARVLPAMRERLLDPGAFDEFCRGFAEEMEARRNDRVAQMAGTRRELETVTRKIRKLIAAITEGVSGASVKDEIAALENRQATLSAALHPNMAEVFRRKATALAAPPEHDEMRDAARLALRSFLDHIVIPPGDGLLQVVGNFGKMLKTAQGRRSGDDPDLCRWLRGRDLNPRPLGYEPNELPDCSTPRHLEELPMLA